MSKFPGVLSCHTTWTLLPDVAIATFLERPGLLLRFFMGSIKLTPPSVLLLYKISPLLSHTTCTLLPETAMTGRSESTAGSLLIFIAGANTPPLSGTPHIEDLCCSFSPNYMYVVALYCNCRI